MASCPNCGRETARTEDWSCQWCGYPLLTGSYKKISKTYRELKEERMLQQPVVEEAEPEPEPEPVLEAEAEVEVMPEAEPEPEPEPEFEPVLEAEAEVEVVPEAEPEPEPEPELEPVLEAEAEVEVEVEVVPEAEPEPELEPEPAPKPRARRKPAAKRKSAPKSTTESKAETRRKAAARTKPPPAALEMTVEELLSAYEVDGEAADAKFANQIIRITGVVDRIEIRDTLDIYYITLVSAEQNLSLQSVRCVFDREYESELEQLTAGETVTVQGEYYGSMIDISLRDCFLVR